MACLRWTTRIAVLLSCAPSPTAALTAIPLLRTLDRAPRVVSPPILQEYDRLRGGASGGDDGRLKLLAAKIAGFVDRRFFLVGVAGAIGLAALVPEL